MNIILLIKPAGLLDSNIKNVLFYLYIQLAIFKKGTEEPAFKI